MVCDAFNDNFHKYIEVGEKFFQNLKFFSAENCADFFFLFSLCQFIYARAIFKCEWVLHLVSQQLFFYRLAYECFLLCVRMRMTFFQSGYSVWHLKVFNFLVRPGWKLIQQKIKISRFVQQYMCETEFFPFIF